MKKFLCVLLTLAMAAAVFAGCSTSAEDEGTTDASAGYQYTFRDLPEAKRITPASDFAGGSGSQSDPYQIADAAQLALMHAKMTDEAYRKANYVLTADISLNDTANCDSWRETPPEYSWAPIGFGADWFSGVFDGGGHTISGMYINENDTSTSDYYGLFNKVNGTVKNVNVDKSYIEVSGNSTHVGTIAGYIFDSAVIENCSADAQLYNYDANCGGIVGYAAGGVPYGNSDSDSAAEEKHSSISGCKFSGTITQIKEDTLFYLGGIVGSSDADIKNCSNSGTLNFSGSNIDSAGGIAGRAGGGSILNCKNTGSLVCESVEHTIFTVAGGIAGKVFVSSIGSEKYMSRGFEMSNCENSGSVSSQYYAGGIIGQLSDDYNLYSITVTGCKNSGSVSGADYSGGIIGHMDCMGKNTQSKCITVSDCENSAEISGSTVGGIVSGFKETKGDVEIKNCNNLGSLTATSQHCAGIIGYWLMDFDISDGNITVDGCKNSGSISSPLNAGGIVCFMDMPVVTKLGKNVSASITNCANSGNITSAKTNGYIGGILGNWGLKDIPTSIDKCTNSGTLAITALADNMTAEDADVMTVSRIAGGIIGRIGPGLLLTTDSDNANDKNVQAKNAVLKITDCINTGKPEITNINAEFYKNWFGGIVGNTCAEDGFSFSADNCTYSNFDRGLGNDTLPDVGTKK